MQLEYFNGFPYMLTLVSDGLFHIAILPGELDLGTLKEVVRWQVVANKVKSCLALSSSCCVYLDVDGAEHVSGVIPRGGINCTGRLQLCRQFPQGIDTPARLELLRAYVDQNGAECFLEADLTKGGRRATPDELRRLGGKHPNAVSGGANVSILARSWQAC